MRRQVTFAVLVFCLATTRTIGRADDVMERRANLSQELEDISRNPDNSNDAERLNRLGEVLFEIKLLDEPEFEMSSDGRKYQDRWQDLSLKAIEWRNRIDQKALKIIRLINRDTLNPANQLNYDLLIRRLEENVNGQKFPSKLLAVRADYGPQDWIPAILEEMGMSAESRADYENILGRLERIPERIDQTIELLNKGLKQKVTLPRVLVERIPKKLLDLVPDDPQQSRLLTSFHDDKFKRTLDPEDQKRLRRRALGLYDERWDRSPIQQRFRSFRRQRFWF
jgi:uncharacterized protein (DUF885 family)